MDGIDSKNLWKWMVIHETYRSQSLKLNRLRKWTILFSNSGRSWRLKLDGSSVKVDGHGNKKRMDLFGRCIFSLFKNISGYKMMYNSYIQAYLIFPSCVSVFHLIQPTPRLDRVEKIFVLFMILIKIYGFHA